ncbi:hypothetical protein [Leifsonia shinshuensis]|uniref:Uncharacterized protein n=1 Tax=Leifsonia shinshuensis TaxID=150026 RepID=A0A853CVK8_9MICO|nr:hypothetical protein [Leifsonia shinshuensis]NYJ24458.1 hypothetical protein [Leifsonia shinshuensis]
MTGSYRYDHILTAATEVFVHQLIELGIAKELNAHGAAHGLEPLSWRVDLEFEPILTGEHPEGAAAPGRSELCDQWGGLLELDPPPAAGEAEGFRVWTGYVRDWTVRVFCVTNEDRYREAFPGDID